MYTHMNMCITVSWHKIVSGSRNFRIVFSGSRNVYLFSPDFLHMFLSFILGSLTLIKEY